VNQDVFFNASSSAAATGHTIVSYTWDFGDGTPSGTGITTSHFYLRAGTFTVTLVVTDDLGQSANTARSVTVSSASGQIVADFVFSPTDPAISRGTNNVFFDATPSSAGVTTWTWDFGDGTTGVGQKPSHLFILAGSWVVRLTVTDSAGRSATTTKTVSVGQ
jgi:PKD repeat protein